MSCNRNVSNIHLNLSKFALEKKETSMGYQWKLLTVRNKAIGVVVPAMITQCELPRGAQHHRSANG